MRVFTHPFTSAFSALSNVFLELTMIDSTIVITRKMQRIAENAYVNVMWQLGLKIILMLHLQLPKMFEWFATFHTTLKILI